MVVCGRQQRNRQRSEAIQHGGVSGMQRHPLARWQPGARVADCGLQIGKAQIGPREHRRQSVEIRRGSGAQIVLDQGLTQHREA